MLKLDLGDAKELIKCAHGYGVSDRTPEAVLGHLGDFKNIFSNAAETNYLTHFQTYI